MPKETDFNTRIAILKEIAKGTQVKDLVDQFGLERSTIYRMRKDAGQRGAFVTKLDVAKLVDAEEDFKLGTKLTQSFVGSGLYGTRVIEVPDLLFQQPEDESISTLQRILLETAGRNLFVRPTDNVVIERALCVNPLEELLRRFTASVQIYDAREIPRMGLSVAIVGFPINMNADVLRSATIRTGIGGGIDQVESIFETLQSGLLTHLITDNHTANTLIELKRS